MGKELIAIEKFEVETQINKVNELVKIINKYSAELNFRNINLTLEDIINMSNDRNKFRNEVYLEELKKVCSMFAQDFSVVSSWEYNIKHSDNMFSNMALQGCEFIFNVCKEVSRLTRWGDNIYLKYIDIKDNIASPKLNYEEDIKEYYSHYAKNDKQEKLTKALKKVQSAVEDAAKLGYSYLDIWQFISKYDNEICYNAVEKL